MLHVFLTVSKAEEALILVLAARRHVLPAALDED